MNPEVKALKRKWQDFKTRRSLKQFDTDTPKNFLTVLQREEMLDKLFELIK